MLFGALVLWQLNLFAAKTPNSQQEKQIFPKDLT
jgi:hypothetical protein